MGIRPPLPKTLGDVPDGLVHQRPGLVMAAIYRTLLDEIKADRGAVLRQRTSLTPIRKLWLAWKTWVTA